MDGVNVKHLYSRACFGVGNEAYENLKDKTLEYNVDTLFFEARNYKELSVDLSELETFLKDNPKSKINKKDKLMSKKIRMMNKTGIKNLNTAWIDRLSKNEYVFNEKMTLFWSNILVCRDNNVLHFQRYNNVLRKNALGNFRDFVKEISKEPSMNKYLNNKQNTKDSPNENFARELMELFTIGIGNYTENDIKESARAFTGWSFRKDGDFVLKRKKHDFGEKTFMGKTGDFDGDDIIDIILDRRESASFICKKVYKYFVNPEIDKRNLEEITDVFYSNYDIYGLMKHIFNSEWFYDDKNIGVKIKSPIELLVGINRVVPIEFNKQRQQLYIQKMMGQVLLYPPNVAGWKGDRNWIDSNTLMFRLKLAANLTNKGKIDLESKGDLEDTYEEYYNVAERKSKFYKTNALWDKFDEVYGDISHEKLKSILIMPKIDKDTEELLSNLNIKSNKEYCVQLMSIPEYQLC